MYKYGTLLFLHVHDKYLLSYRMFLNVDTVQNILEQIIAKTTFIIRD